MYESTNNLIKKFKLINNNSDIPTRNNTILYVIFSNNNKKVIQTEVISNNECSDHHPVVLTRSLNNCIEAQKYSYFRFLKNLDVNDVEKRLIGDERQVKILESNNPTEALNLLVDMLNDSISHTVPMIKLRNKKVDNKTINLSNSTIKYSENVDLQKAIAKANPNKIEKKNYSKI